MEPTLLERYKGAMVGVHVGDALGAPYEKTFSAKQIAEDIETRGGLTFFDYPDPWAKKGQGSEMFPAGRPTDDSDQTADLAWSLITCNGLNTEHLHEALRNSVVLGKSRLWPGVAKGAGGTTCEALSGESEKVAKALSNPIGTNGSLMRSVPLILYYHEQDNIDEKISAMSSVTHANQHSIDACSMYGEYLTGILDWMSRENIFELLSHLQNDKSSYLKRRVTLSLLDTALFPVDPGAWPARGTAEFSLYVALWCFKHATSFADGIEKAIRIGGDTDTYAAITGGLLGAYYGYEGIPKEWRQGILGHDVMCEYAKTIYATRSRA